MQLIVVSFSCFPLGCSIEDSVHKWVAAQIRYLSSSVVAISIFIKLFYGYTYNKKSYVQKGPGGSSYRMLFWCLCCINAMLLFTI